MITRRHFIRKAAGVTGLSLIGPEPLFLTHKKSIDKKLLPIEIIDTSSNFEREPLIRPFGFKGGYMSEIWQTIAQIKIYENISKIGLCTQNVLWSDARVFTSHSEAGGNALMYAITEYALNVIKGRKFKDPIQLLEDVFDDVHEFGKTITRNPDLRKTFTLNALVGVDNAAWLVFANKNGIRSFDEMIPERFRPALSYRNDKVASIPLMAYSIPIEEIKEAVDQGYFFMKIKIGQPGSQKEMLEKDKQRLTEIHKAIGSRPTPYTKNGKIPYYFDANGRYEDKATLLALIDHAEKIGAADQIVIIEEPFPEEKEIMVDDIGIRIAADESAHTDEDALERIQMGYKAIALKAIAKTLSMTLKIARLAHEHNIPCFCADLTVNPILVEWNKNVAARLSPFPETGLGLLETNGHQNYKNWDKMVSNHPFPEAEWRKTKEGVFNLDEDYYTKSGGIFSPIPHYMNMFDH